VKNKGAVTFSVENLKQILAEASCQALDIPKGSVVEVEFDTDDEGSVTAEVSWTEPSPDALLH
jgi:hypothetical protein